MGDRTESLVSGRSAMRTWLLTLVLLFSPGCKGCADAFQDYSMITDDLSHTPRTAPLPLDISGEWVFQAVAGDPLCDASLHLSLDGTSELRAVPLPTGEEERRWKLNALPEVAGPTSLTGHWKLGKDERGRWSIRVEPGEGNPVEFLLRSQDGGPPDEKEGTAAGGPYRLVHRRYDGHGPFLENRLHRVVSLRDPGRVVEKPADAALVGAWNFTEGDSLRVLGRKDPLTGIRFEADGTARWSNIPGRLQGELLDWSETTEDSEGFLDHGVGKWQLVRVGGRAWGVAVSGEKARTVLGLWRVEEGLMLALESRGEDDDRDSLVFLRRISD